MAETPERFAERIVTTLTVHGVTLDQIFESAKVELDAFFKGHAYEFLEIKARPSLQTMGRADNQSGTIALWEADIEAAEVWA